MADISETDIFRRIQYFFFKLLPEAKLAKSFTKDSIFGLIKEGFEVSELWSLDLLNDLKDVDEEIVTENALEAAVYALLDNLRFGSNHCDLLKEALYVYTNSNLQYIKFAQIIDTRKVERQDYLYSCTLVQDSRYKDELKAYLKFKQFVLVHSINASKVEPEICQMNKNIEDRMKLITMLSLQIANDYFEVSIQIARLVEFDFPLIRRLNVTTLSSAVKSWPAFRTRVFNLISKTLSEAQSIRDIERIAHLILSLLITNKNKIDFTPNDAQLDGIVRGELMAKLDSNVNVSKFFKTELLLHLEAGLERRSRMLSMPQAG
eukprot:TRINITY_DN12893_c0_g1_i11.p1 TRINITY_DN12893_c0_g1~~TRINITY_DN12893_c0_g1_i11.p1  ORF type:complete len:333 (-),score=39.45 TRINITY_DN12893_c0_g1_i11:377-1333(-)